MVEVAEGLAQEEARIQTGSLEFYRAGLPAGPILVLGFLCLEGKEVHFLLAIPSGCPPTILSRVLYMVLTL